MFSKENIISCSLTFVSTLLGACWESSCVIGCEKLLFIKLFVITIWNLAWATTYYPFQRVWATIKRGPENRHCLQDNSASSKFSLWSLYYSNVQFFTLEMSPIPHVSKWKSPAPLTLLLNHKIPHSAFFFDSILWWSQSDHDPQEDLARFGYKLNMKGIKKKHPSFAGYILELRIEISWLKKINWSSSG
jgi:hypothetical protein